MAQCVISGKGIIEPYFYGNGLVTEDAYIKMVRYFRLLQATRLASKYDFSAIWNSTSFCPHRLQLPWSECWKPSDWQRKTYHAATALSKPEPLWLYFVGIYKRARISDLPESIGELEARIEKQCLQFRNMNLKKGCDKEWISFSHAFASKWGTYWNSFTLRKIAL